MATSLVGKRPEQIRDEALRVDAARRLDEVNEELEAAMRRRTELWQEQSARPSAALSEEIKALSEQINGLWAEARKRRACVRAGSRQRILTRVRAEARFEREARKANGGSQ
jgi:hypothetical protein